MILTACCQSNHVRKEHFSMRWSLCSIKNERNLSYPSHSISYYLITVHLLWFIFSYGTQDFQLNKKYCFLWKEHARRAKCQQRGPAQLLGFHCFLAKYKQELKYDRLLAHPSTTLPCRSPTTMQGADRSSQPGAITPKVLTRDLQSRSGAVHIIAADSYCLFRRAARSDSTLASAVRPINWNY